jgi:hypothetical protein
LFTFFVDYRRFIRQLSIMIYRPSLPLTFIPLSAVVLLCSFAGRAAAASASVPMQVVTAGVIAPIQSYVAQDTKPPEGPAFQPAPMPDPDLGPPSGNVSRGASLTPALFSHKAEFEGDGYSTASDPDHGLDKRRTPAAGLNWSVPVR